MALELTTSWWYVGDRAWRFKVQFMSKLLAVQDHIQTSVHSSITPKVSSCGSAPGDGRLLGFAGQKMNAKLGLVFSYLQSRGCCVWSHWNGTSTQWHCLKNCFRTWTTANFFQRSVRVLRFRSNVLELSKCFHWLNWDLHTFAVHISSGKSGD